MTTDVSVHEGPTSEPVAAGDGNGNPLPSDTARTSQGAASLAASLLIPTAQGDDRLSLRHPQETAGQEPFPAGRSPVPGALPIETTAGPAGAVMSGGGSRYDGDFGQLIAGLRANASDDALARTQTPGIGAPIVAGSGSGGDLLPFARATNAASPASSGGGDATDIGGNDTTASGEDAGGGGDHTGSGGEDTSSGEDTTATGEDTSSDLVSPALFTVHSDSVDFNIVIAGTYREGTQYDADNKNDVVFLPDDAAKAAQAGFASGTHFLAGNGDDTVIGGGLADLIHGGNGNDLLDGGTGNDTLVAGVGKDTLVGGLGDDVMTGGQGKDTLIGGLGDDAMTGGQGKDTFGFSLSANEGKDLILDFTPGKGGDILQIADLVDVTGEGQLTVTDLDAGGHSVSGQADAIVITFGSGTSITLAGLNGTGVNSFADLVNDARVQIDTL